MQQPTKSFCNNLHFSLATFYKKGLQKTAYGLGLAFTYYSSRHYYRNAEYLSLGEDGSFLELGLAMMPGRYHSKAAVALKETMKTIF